MASKKLICFDMDGTLLDASKAHAEAYFKAFEKNNLKKVKKKDLISRFGIVGKVLIKELYPRLSDRKIKKVNDDHDHFLIKETYKYSRAIKGAKKIIKDLRKKFKIALISNCKYKTILPLLKRAGFKKEWFDLILGSDNVKRAKPAPDIIFRVERLLRMDAEYMIGDTIYDIKTGKSSKTKTIAVLTGTHSRRKLKKENPYLIIKNVSILKKILL